MRQILGPEVTNHAVVDANNGRGKVAFSFLQLKNLLFDRIAGDQPISKNVPFLSDAMGAVDCLRFYCRIPPRIENEYILGGREIQP